MEKESQVPGPYGLATSTRTPSYASNLNQPSTVRLAGRSEGASGITMYWLTPFNTNAWPTSPDPNDAPLINVPLLPPIMSSAFPSAGHQPIRSAGGGAHGGTGLTVSRAFEL